PFSLILPPISLSQPLLIQSGASPCRTAELLQLPQLGKQGRQARSGNAPDQEGQPVLCVTNTGQMTCAAVPKMEVGLPKSACRSGLQTTRCCCIQKVWW